MADVVNSFQGGLHRDNDEIYQPKDTYRDCLNKNLISDGQGNFVLETAKGTTVAFTLSATNAIILGWVSFGDDIYTVSVDNSKIWDFDDNQFLAGNLLGFTGASDDHEFNVGDKVLVRGQVTHEQYNAIHDVTVVPDVNNIETDSSFLGDTPVEDGVMALVKGGEIGRIKIDPSTGTGTYETLYVHDDLNLCALAPIPEDSIKIIKENDSIVRLYWTDEINPPRVLNVRSSKILDTIDSGSLVVGEEYMVRTSTITHGAVVYGPNAAAGNVFTATGTTYTGSGEVIEYIPVSLLDWSPNYEMGEMYWSGFVTGGNVPCGAYAASYRLISDEGYKTPWSYMTRPLYVGAEEIPNPVYGELTYQSYQGDENNVNSKKSLKIKFEGLDLTYDKIEVALVRYTGKDVFDTPKIVFDQDITAAEMELTYTGDEDFGFVTNDDLAEFLVSFDSVRTIETTKNRMFAGKVETRSELGNYDATGTAVDYFIYEFPSDLEGHPGIVAGSPSVNSESLHGSRISNSPKVAAAAGEIVQSAKYRVEGTSADAILYNAVTYYGGDIFEGVVGVTTFTVSAGTPVVNAIAFIQKFKGSVVASGSLVVGGRYIVDTTPVTHNTKAYGVGDSFVASATTYTGAGTIRNHEIRIIPIENDIYDTKGLAVGANFQPYPRGEKIRLAVVFFDKKGNPFAARHIEDFDTPTIEDEQLVTAYGTYPNEVWTINNLGLKIGSNANPLDLSDTTGLANELGLTDAELTDKISGFSIVRAERIKRSVAQGVLFRVVKDENYATSELVRPEFQNILNNDHHFAAPGGGLKSRAYLFYSPDNYFTDNGLFDGNVILENLKLEVADIINDQSLNTAGAPEGAVETTNNHYYHKLYTSQANTSTLEDKGETVDIKDLVVVPYNELVGINIDSDITTEKYVSGTQAAGFAPGIPGREGTGSKAVAIITHKALDLYETLGNTDRKFLCNILARDVVSYGSINVETYYSTGHYQPLNSDVFAANGNSWKFEDIEIWGGDIFVNFFDVGRITYLEDPAIATEYSSGIVFPVESNLHFNFRRGRHLSRDRSRELGPPEVNKNGLAPTQPENYILDDHYSTVNSNKSYASLPPEVSDNTKFDRRVHYSDIKVDGEVTDNFRVFRQNNFRDLENEGRSIVAMRRKEGRLFVWQENDWIYLPVNERATISDPLGGQVQLGVGGTLDRYDEISERYGLQDRKALQSTKNGFVWIDKNKMTIIFANASGGVVEVHTAKGLRSYLDSILFTKKLMKADYPMHNIAIVSGYDEKFDRVLFSFKAPDITATTLAFNDTIGVFTGFFSFVASNYLTHKSYLYSTLSDHYDEIADATSYAVGDIVVSDGALFICNTAYTSGTPATDPKLDGNWSKGDLVTDGNLHNTGDYCKFYGIVYDEMLEYVVNPATNVYKVYDVLRVIGNDNMHQTIEYNNSYQTVTETGADTSFKFRLRSWYNSIKRMATNERLRDYYLKVKLTRNHYNGGTDPITSDGLLVKLKSIITKFRQSR